MVGGDVAVAYMDEYLGHVEDYNLTARYGTFIIGERTISMSFLGIILRVLRLEVSVWLSQTLGKWVCFSVRLSSLLLNRNCNRLREFEEI